MLVLLLCDNRLAHWRWFINDLVMSISDQPPSKNDKRSPMAGGIFIFIGLLIGVVVGVAKNEASIGMIAGLAGGSIIALMLWIFDHFRKQD
jgi:uncharacterized membrane protein